MTERPLLRLLAWLSPAFPTGAFAYSHGLEWVVEARDIKDGDSLLVWLSDTIARGAGRTDTILLRLAHRAMAASEAIMACGEPSAKMAESACPTSSLTLGEIAELAAATASSRERQFESLAQGRAFLLAAAPWSVPEMPEDTPYPVAVGAVAGLHRIPEDATAAAYLQTFATNLISAAVRLVPLGQNAGLRVLAALEPVVLATAEATRDATEDDVGGCAFRSDMASMRHETQYTRLFRS